MKKRIGLLMTCVLASSALLSACGNDEDSGEKSKFRVDMVADIGGIDDKYLTLCLE